MLHTNYTLSKIAQFHHYVYIYSFTLLHYQVGRKLLQCICVITYQELVVREEYFK